MSVFFAAVLSALITSAALLIQGYLQNKREDARLSAEVERRAEDWRREQERRAEDRRDALDDYWRDARHRAHVNALSAMQSALEGLDDVGRLSREEGVPVSRGAVQEFGMELVRTVTEVRLICTDAAAKAADEAYLTMVALNLGVSSKITRGASDLSVGWRRRRTMSRPGTGTLRLPSSITARQSDMTWGQRTWSSSPQTRSLDWTGSMQGSGVLGAFAVDEDRP